MMVILARNVLLRRFGLGAFLACTFSLGVAVAQPTNVEVLQTLAVECLPDAGIPDSVIVDARAAQEYIRSAVVAHLIAHDAQVYAPESDAPTLAVLRLTQEEPKFVYRRQGRRIDRSAELRLRVTLQMADGRIAREDECVRTYEDQVDRSQIAALETSAYPGTSAPIPAASWRRRYAEPIVMAGATAVAVLLFFSLRSKRAPDE